MTQPSKTTPFYTNSQLSYFFLTSITWMSTSSIAVDIRNLEIHFSSVGFSDTEYEQQYTYQSLFLFSRYYLSQKNEVNRRISFLLSFLKKTRVSHKFNFHQINCYRHQFNDHKFNIFSKLIVKQSNKNISIRFFPK